MTPSQKSRPHDPLSHQYCPECGWDMDFRYLMPGNNGPVIMRMCTLGCGRSEPEDL